MKAAIAGLLVLTSCSFVFSRPPPATASADRTREADCSTSNIAPALDTTVAVVAAFFIVLVVASEPCTGTEDEGCNPSIEGEVEGLIALTSFVVGGPAVVSALHGFDSAGRCKRQHRAAGWQQSVAAQRQNHPAAGSHGQECRLGERLGDITCDAQLSCVQGRCLRRDETGLLGLPCRSAAEGYCVRFDLRCERGICVRANP